MGRLLLVDGNSIVNRAYYAVIGRAPMTAPDGTPTGAVNGFFNSLLSVTDEYSPDSICVLFDRREPTFRHKMSDEYKANRKGMPDDMAAQMPVIKELLDHMGIARYELPGYEADDLIGTLSRLAEDEGDEVFILSGDHDDFQLISDKTKVILPQSGKGKPPRVLYDKELFFNENGITPDRFIYVKALMGDSSDNIKGVDKVGPKTAFRLIADYGTVDGVIEHKDELSAALKANIEQAQDQLALNMKLVTIDRFAPVDISIADTKFDEIKDKQALFDRLSALALRSLIKKLKLESMSLSEEALSGSAEEDPSAENIFIRLDELTGTVPEDPSVDDVPMETVVSLIDSETGSEGGAVGLDFSSSGDRKICILALWNEGKILFLSPERLTGACERTNAFIPVGFEYKDRSKILPCPLPKIDSVFDTYVAGSVLNLCEGKPDFIRLYESAARRPCKWEAYSAKEGQLSLFDDEADKNLKDELKSLARRVLSNLACYHCLKAKIEKEGAYKLLYEIEFPLVVTLDKIERNGMHVSYDILNDLHSEYQERLASLRDSIYEMTGEEFNISSTKQLSDVLFSEDKLNLPHGKKGKTGVYSTDSDELNRLRRYSPVIDPILDYRELSKLDSTYASGLMRFISEDGRIHTTFTQAMTNTGRLSSTEPNLQNIPVRSDEGSRLRAAFTAAPGKVLVDADYSQIELRLLAALSGDEYMTDAFLKGEDIHKMTATRIFGVSEDEVTHKMRSSAKTVNFSIIYGISDYGLSNDLKISIAEASEIIKQYSRQFPGITAYLDGLKEQGEKKGYAETMFGRKWILNELKSQNRNVKNFGLRVAMNTPIQGTAADIIKIAMNKVSKALEERFPEAKLVMQVHDELIIECPPEIADECAALLKEEMEGAASLKVPLVAEVNSGKDWLEAK